MTLRRAASTRSTGLTMMWSRWKLWKEMEEREGLQLYLDDLGEDESDEEGAEEH